MLDHLRIKVINTFDQQKKVVLSSYGPADIQSSWVECAVDYEQSDPGLRLAVPYASEHLVNIGQRPFVFVLGEGWDMFGRVAKSFLVDGDAGSICWVRVIPIRLQIRQRHPETIDF